MPPLRVGCWLWRRSWTAIRARTRHGRRASNQGVCRAWTGKPPVAPRGQRCQSTCRFGAVCADRGVKRTLAEGRAEQLQQQPAQPLAVDRARSADTHHNARRLTYSRSREALNRCKPPHANKKHKAATGCKPHFCLVQVRFKYSLRRKNPGSSCCTSACPTKSPLRPSCPSDPGCGAAPTSSKACRARPAVPPCGCPTW